MTIREKVRAAIRWTVIAKVSGQLITWVATLVVIRLLSPADYGLMAMAMIFPQLLLVLSSIGLEIVLVQRSDLGEKMRAQIFGAIIITNFACFLIMLLSAGPLADFFGEPQLRLLISVLSIQYLIILFEDLPIAHLERKLEFKMRSIIEFSSMLAASAVTLFMALAGLGIWALIVGHLVMHATKVGGLNIVAPVTCRPRFSLKGMREIFAFGGFVSLGRVLWFSFAESDKLIGGKLLGKEPLGFYTVANQLASLPINKISGLISSVAFPAFSKVQMDMVSVRFYLRKSARLMSMFAFPVFFGISAVAPNIVAIALGQKWLDATIPLQILSVVMPLRMISTVMPPVLWGIGRPGVSAINFLIAGVVMIPTFVIGAQFGAIGLATAWLALYPLVFIIKTYRMSNVVGFAVGDFIGEMGRPALAATGMLGAVYAARQHVFNTTNSIVQFLLLILIGIVVYVLLTFVVNRSGAQEALDLFREKQEYVDEPENLKDEPDNGLPH